MGGVLALGVGVAAASLAAAVPLDHRVGLPAAADGSPAYADGPPPAHTGGFGEPTCRECHFDGPEEPVGVRLEVDGLPARYRPGRSYTLTVALEAPRLRRGGFELSTRFLARAQSGDQAGVLASESGRAEVVTAPPSGEAAPSEPIAYARQTAEGSVVGGGAAPAIAGGEAGRDRSGRLSWSLTWTAPDSCSPFGCGAVALDVAANAANDDASEFGDRIVARRLVVPGPRGRPSPSFRR